MRENKYDDPVFFEKYGQMDRSKLGLAGAGEWEALRELMPEFQWRRGFSGRASGRPPRSEWNMSENK